jgi:hypothetical protein
MRQMVKGETVLNITEHIITSNKWEYYVTDNRFSDDIVCCLVMGFETEIGDVSLSEITPYIISRTKNLNDILPAEGWEWKMEWKGDHENVSNPM